MIGDSITHYWGRSACRALIVRVADAWQRAFAGYVRRCQSWLRLGPHGERALAHCSWRTSTALIQDRVILMIGTNNLEIDSPEEVLAGIDAICRTIHAKLPKARILVLGILPLGKTKLISKPISTK